MLNFLCFMRDKFTRIFSKSILFNALFLWQKVSLIQRFLFFVIQYEKEAIETNVKRGLICDPFTNPFEHLKKNNKLPVSGQQCVKYQNIEMPF